MKSVTMDTDDLISRNEEDKTNSPNGSMSKPKQNKMKRLSTVGHIGALSNCLLKPSFWNTPNFKECKESDKNMFVELSQK